MALGHLCEYLGLEIYIFWIRFFPRCLRWPRAFKTHKNDKNRQGHDLAIVSRGKGKRSSPRDRLCWWYFSWFVLKTEFYVGLAFSSPNQKAEKKSVTPLFEIVSASQSWPFIPAGKRTARDDASNFHHSSCKSWALQAFAGDGAGSGACAVSQRAKMTTNCFFLLSLVHFWYIFRLSQKTGILSAHPLLLPRFFVLYNWRANIYTLLMVPKSYR